MQAYSMDLRERALLDSDAGMKAADVAVKYRVSGSWVRLLKQRRRETGDVAPRVQRHGRRRMLEPHLHTLAALIAEQPDRTLAELKDALGTPASLATIWRAVAALDVTPAPQGFLGHLIAREYSQEACRDGETRSGFGGGGGSPEGDRRRRRGGPIFSRSEARGGAASVTRGSS